MKNINSYRVFRKNSAEPDSEGDYVLYWMQINRRFHYNYALEYAIGWANRLNKPLVILEGLSCDYPWATRRSHKFMMQGMKEHHDIVEQMGKREARLMTYYPFIEHQSGECNTILKELSGNACLLVTDEYPVFIMRERNETLPKTFSIPYICVDSNGFIPLGKTTKSPYGAYHFRKIMQRTFVESYTHPPEANPIEKLDNRDVVSLSGRAEEQIFRSKKDLQSIDKVVSAMSTLRQDVDPVNLTGDRQSALLALNRFIEKRIFQYDSLRNHPDEEGGSGLSPWLHSGKISEFEIVETALKSQPDDWDLNKIQDQNGSSDGFFNGNSDIAKFLDEVITWRETGFHFAHHCNNYDEYESLPDWSRKSLEEHVGDPREYIYSYNQLENAQTHDPLWNAAQKQLRSEGIIHNYLRMLWGKKVLEWTPDPETAISYLIELNNTWAIDGRDPNSYSGIFWCFGRFDRPWPEREIFGKIRYMTSKSTRSKLRLSAYLKRYGEE